MIFGRSIGTGPATLLASKNNPAALLLMSPFTSIKNIIKESSIKYLSFLVQDRFKNVEIISRVSCPTFLVHGKKDTLISYRHSQELYCRCGGPSSLIIPKEMDHNTFDFIDDLI